MVQGNSVGANFAGRKFSLQNGDFDIIGKSGGGETVTDGQNDAFEYEGDSDEMTIEGELPMMQGVSPNAKIIVTVGRDEGRRFELTGAMVSLGRAMDNDIVLTDLAVSRHHLQIEKKGTSYLMRDLSSGNGTLVNGLEPPDRVQLRHQDRLEVGNTILTFDNPVAARAEQVPAFPTPANLQANPSSYDTPGPALQAPNPRLKSARPGSHVVPQPMARSASQSARISSGPSLEGGDSDSLDAIIASTQAPPKASRIGILWIAASLLGMVAVGVTVWAIMRPAPAITVSNNDSDVLLPPDTTNQDIDNGANEPSADAVTKIITPEERGTENEVPADSAKTQKNAAAEVGRPDLLALVTTTGKRSPEDLPRDLWGNDVFDDSDGPRKPVDTQIEVQRVENNTAVPSTDEGDTRDNVDIDPNNLMPGDVGTDFDAKSVRSELKAFYKKRAFGKAQSLIKRTIKNSPAAASTFASDEKRYRRLDDLFRKIESRRTSPTEVLRATRSALSVDRKLGGAHKSYLNRKQRDIAGDAAQKYLAQNKYAEAKKTAALASKADAKKINGKLTDLAAGRYKQAKAIDLSSPSGKRKAQTLLKQAREIAPKSSKVYRDSTEMLKELSKK